MPLLLAIADVTQVNPGLTFWTIATFIVVLVILSQVAWKPMLGLIEEREKAIRDSIDAAKRERAEAEKLLAEQRSAIADARREAAEMMKKNKEETERMRAEDIGRAKKEADELVAAARRQIEDEKKKALAEVKGFAVDLALQAASKLLSTTLDDAKHKQLVEEYLNKLPASQRPQA